MKLIILAAALTTSFSTFEVSAQPTTAVGGSAPSTVQAVDLGLPSGTLWAPWNVGATKPYEAGAYFAWGETTTKTNYSWLTYKWLSNRTGNVDDMWRHINKYQLEKEEGADWFDDLFYSTGDGKSTLDPEDDAATANWGTAWKTPDEEQINELFNLNNCSREWKVRNDGIAGVLFISKRNGKRLFLPAAGYRTGYDLRDYGNNGYYASSQIEDPYRSREIFVHFYIDPVVIGNTIYSNNYFSFQRNTADRSNGYTVRPVLVKKRKR